MKIFSNTVNGYVVFKLLMIFADLIRLVSSKRKKSLSAGGLAGRGKQHALKGQGKKLSSSSDRTAGRGIWSRFECKYHISEGEAAAIEKFVSPYLHLDRYCRLRKERAYDIVSLYLDNDDLQLYQENLVGRKNRFKLRIRSYSEEPSSPCFFEIKRRINRIVIKSRVSGSREDATNLLAGKSLPSRKYPKEDEILRQFQLYMHSVSARPKLLVRYIRRAYEGDTDNRVRVTFDRRLAYKPTNSEGLSFNGRGWQWSDFTRPGVILEIKFTGSFPAWLNQMTRCFNLRQRSISKYATSIKRSINQGFRAAFVEDELRYG